MKKIILLGLAFFTAGNCISAEFHRGGVTFPLEQFARRAEAHTRDTGKNLFRNSDFSAPLVTWKQPDTGWYNTIWIAGQGNMAKYLKATENIASGRIVETDRGKALELLRPLELENRMGEDVTLFTTSFNQTVRLPDENGGLYVLSFDNRTQCIGDKRYAQMLLFTCRDGSSPIPGRGKVLKGYNIRIMADPQWHSFRQEFNVPPGTRDVSVSIRADGCGKLQFRNPCLARRTAPSTPIRVEMTPGKDLDHTFFLASGAPGVLGFKFRSNLPPGTLSLGKVMMNLELPAGISVNGTNAFFGKEITGKEIESGGKKWKRWMFELKPVVTARIGKSQEFDTWNLACAMISGEMPPGTLWQNCRYYLTENDKYVSNIETFSLKIMAPFQQKTHPKLFFSGFSSCARDIQFQQPEAENRMAELIGTTGTTLLTTEISPAYSEKLRQNRVRLITSECYSIANGYRIGIMSKEKKPEYSKFRGRDGKAFQTPDGIIATCPAAVYNRTPYYKDVILPLLKSSLAGLNGLQPNWEPFQYKRAGCFCDTCRDEFMKFAGFSPEEMKKVWPQQLLPGYPCEKLAIRFRATQHARMIKTLHKDSLALGATAVGFCPEVGFDQIIRYPDSEKEHGEYSPYEYAGSLKWLNVWGPYNANSLTQFVYRKGLNLRTWEISKRVIHDYRKHFPDPAKRAKLMAMPLGNGGTRFFAQPEGMAMDQISSFLAGYEASILYFFPRGCDHRFWQALADSTALIAANEDMVMNGRRLDGVSVIPQTPFPAAVKNIEPRYLPEVKESSLLQAAAFRKGEKILAAVGNFWEKGDVVFLLRIPGLDPEKSYSVQEKAFGRSFIDEKGKSFTGKDLADGILLHAGALRWVFFEMEPEPRNHTGKAVTSAEMRRELALCSRRNKKPAEEEAALDKAFLAESEIGEFKKLKNGILACEPLQKENKVLLKVVSARNSLLLNPRGMALESWNVNGVEQIQPGYGLSAFWTPGRHGRMMNYNYRLVKQEISESGLCVTAELVTSAKTYPELSGLKIVKTINISSDLKQISFDVKLCNTLAVALDGVGYRWHLIPAAWSNRNHGYVKCKDQKFNRPYHRMLLTKDCDPASEKRIRSLFEVIRPTEKIWNNQFEFVIPRKTVMESIFLPAENFAGAAVWDTMEMIAPTFEPFYQPRMIEPNGSISCKAEFKITEEI